MAALHAVDSGRDEQMTGRGKRYQDSDECKCLLRKLEDWWQEARDHHADNRREMMIDADYYDTMQWTQRDAESLLARGQAPLSFPIIKQLCDWVIGTERRTRIDWNVLPRGEEDVDAAQVKKELLKFVADINSAGWERSKQFGDTVRVGVGFMEECANTDDSEAEISISHQDWKGIWWDPYSRHNTFRDARYVTRAKWLDLDYAIAMWPDLADQLGAHAVTSMDPVQEQLELEGSMPMMFFGRDNPMARSQSHTSFIMGSNPVSTRSRKRILGLETWYKHAANVPIMLGDGADELHGKKFDRHNKEHQTALNAGEVSLQDSVSEVMSLAIWTPGLLMRNGPSPYKHKRFPFTPCWGYRRHRDGMPYGIIRPSRDAQDEYNKRRSKILYELNTNRVVYETGAMDEADESRNLDEAKRPDAEIRLARDGMDRFKIDKGLDALSGQVEMLAEAKSNIYESSGVTRENTGTSSGDQSGRAILAKQQQGAVTTAELFDNFRQAIQESGQKTLSLCEQFLTLPKVIRVTGVDGGFEWISVNEPQLDPMTGEVIWNNDITATQADFVVDQSDYRETVRMAMSEMMFELIGKMPGEAGLQLLDVAIDLTDLPNKDVLAARIRSITHQPAPGKEMDPEAVQKQRAMQAAAQFAQSLEQQQAAAEIGLTKAKTAKTTAEARKTGVQGKAEALDTAGMLAQLSPLAPAADRLWNPNPPPPAAPTIEPDEE